MLKGYFGGKYNCSKVPILVFKYFKNLTQLKSRINRNKKEKYVK
jgi:hypothetical protein